jgi:hypothetical protein
LERSFANPRVKGSAASSDAMTELSRLRRKIELTAAERYRLIAKENAADLARRPEAARAALEKCVKLGRQIDDQVDILAATVVEALDTSHEAVEAMEGLESEDWNRHLVAAELGRRIALALYVAADDPKLRPAGVTASTVTAKDQRMNRVSNVNTVVEFAQNRIRRGAELDFDQCEQTLKRRWGPNYQENEQILTRELREAQRRNPRLAALLEENLWLSNSPELAVEVVHRAWLRDTLRRKP